MRFLSSQRFLNLFSFKLKTPILPLLFIALVISITLQVKTIQDKKALEKNILSYDNKISSLSARIKDLENEDLRVTNEKVKATLSATQNAFESYAKLLEKIQDAKFQKVNVASSEAELPKIVSLLSKTSWVEAQKKITDVRKIVDRSTLQNQTATSIALGSAPQSNTLSGDGFSRQTVSTTVGSFVVTLIASDLSSTRVLTDTASEDDDCVNKSCPTLQLSEYVARNGGFAGINGTYFCPPDYAHCADKPGQFDTLVFNSRLKKYLNSDNNKFSTVPMFVQTANHGIRFMGQSVEWGRDTGIIGGLANQPLLVSGGSAATSDSGGAGGRNFIGTKAGKVYIGHVHGANFGQAAKVLETLGMESALNLDTGGSTALYYNGRYILGPGRLIPNAIILAR